MDRLTRRLKKRKYRALFVAVILIILLLCMVSFRPKVQQSEFLEYLKSNNVQAGSQQVKGHGQIYYEYKNKRIFLTDDKFNHLSPESNGQYIVWLDEVGGQTQVILRDLAQNTNLQLSIVNKNSNPSIDKNKVAWESQTGDLTYILYFDGANVKKISTKYSAIRPFVRGNQVLFTQQVDTSRGIWQTILYDGGTKQQKIIIEGTAEQAAWPRFEGDKIRSDLKDSAAYY